MGASGPHGIDLFRIDTQITHRLLHHVSLDLSFPKQSCEDRQCDESGIDFKEIA
jgi:hypothetical protein